MVRHDLRTKDARLLSRLDEVGTTEQLSCAQNITLI